MTPERSRQVDRLYHAALDREPEVRSAFLQSACQADQDLRREVESLLARDTSGNGLLDQPAWQAAPSLIEDPTRTALAPGTQLGPYRIEGPIGAGGMGQVYKARDTRLGRDVAIKISAQHFSDRFEREARAIAALNHPHICTLHDVGPNYLVMELVEGQTLADRLKKGALRIEQVLQYGAEIADALAAAHSHGIIHRDLKPGNIMLTKSGVKVLDFGLAKSQQDETMTSPQAVMGSPAYMGPEQRDGKQCDARTDIYSLGLVLYEMATGKRIVRDQAQTIGGMPTELAPIVERCIAVDPEDRWQAAKDVKAVLEWASKPQARSVAGKSRRSWTISAAVAFIAIVAAGASWEWWRAPRSTPLRPLIRLEAAIPQGTALATNNGGGVLAISPDGSRLALALRGADGTTRLYTRLLRENQFAPLAGAENAFSPFFSPDGQWIGFFADGKLKKISFAGGGAVTLCDAGFPDGASWGDDGNIVFAPRPGQGLWRISSEGGAAAPLTKVAGNDIGHRFPQVLPGSRAVLFTTHSTGAWADNDSSDLVVFSMKTGQRKTLQKGGYSGRYVVTPKGSGRLIYMRHGTLFAAPFDLARLAVTGTPVPVLEKITSGPGGGNFDFSTSGIFSYVDGEAQQGNWTIFRADTSGNMEPIDSAPAAYYAPRFSLDGKHLAFSIARENGSDLWVQDLGLGTPSRLTFFDGISDLPVWTPDQKIIIFKHNGAIFWIRADGAGGAKRLSEGRETPRSISPDGKRLSFVHYDPAGPSLFNANPSLVTAALEGNPAELRLGKREVFLNAPLGESSPMFSPDGRWMAYMSTESGTPQVYVRPFPGPGGRWQISTEGGRFPVWSLGGQELVYQGPDQRLMVVSYAAHGDSFSASKPRVWSQTLVTASFGGYMNWDLAPDGRHVAAVLQRLDGRLTFLLNFFDELERKVPAR